MASALDLGYSSSSEDEGSRSASKPVSTSALIPAPDVSLEDSTQLQMMQSGADDNILTYNVTYDTLARPTQGPANPFKSADGNVLKRKNVLTGNATETVLSEATFRTEHRTFQSLGYTKNPTVDGAYVGNQDVAARYGGRDIVEIKPTKDESAAIRRKRQRKGDAGIVEGEGAYLGPWARYQDDDIAYDEEAGLADQELASDEEWVEEGVVEANLAAPPKEATAYQDDMGASETTEFHGESLYDYQGRTYMHVPQDLDIDLRKEPGSIQNYHPKKLIREYKSHTKAITSLRFFPRSSHLLLSSSADTKIKIWSVHHSRNLLRTFSGHSNAVTDTDFHPTGKTFLSASYDRQMKLWDTETGTCISRFSTGKIPHCIRFQPADGGHEFLAGMSDKKIIQFDTRSSTSSTRGTSTINDLTQEYDHHLGPINSLTFVDDNRRFISTSDDKSLRAWEFNIPVPIKFIADPSMYALTRASPHPSGKYVVFQSADNQIVVYAAGDKFRQNRKKSFRGHNTSGYAIDVAVSPDGGIVASGDSGGYLCFWDWKTGRMWHKIMAGGEARSAVTCVAWNQQESSRLASGGLDGVVRYWD